MSCGNSLHAEAGPDLFYLEYSVSCTLFCEELPLVLLLFFAHETYASSTARSLTV